MQVRLSETPSVLYREGNRCYTNNGSVVYGFRLALREVYASAEKDFDTMHDLWYNALRDFEEGTVVHKCDIYLRKRFDSYGMPAKTFLQRETQKHFEGRAYSDHHSFIFFVFNENGKVVNDGYKNPFKKPIKTVEYLKEYERQHKFELTVERCLDYVNNSRYISMEPITEDVFKYLEFSYFNGFYEDRFTDVDLDKMTVGSKHISVMAVNQLKQLGEQVKTWCFCYFWLR